MTMWLYQMNQKDWNPSRYRLEIWEGERWTWSVRKASWGGERPEPGDTVAFFYAPSRGTDAGFYGWAVVLEWLEKSKKLYFRPVAPSDYLKMHPWWDENAKHIATNIRGKVSQGTLWYVKEDFVPMVREGIRNWINNA